MRSFPLFIVLVLLLPVTSVFFNHPGIESSTYKCASTTVPVHLRQSDDDIDVMTSNGPTMDEGIAENALDQKRNQDADSLKEQDPFVLVLGVAQDAGYPQAGCLKSCCQGAWLDRKIRRMPSCVAIVDPKTGQRWLLDCTWQLPDQLNLLNQIFPRKESPGIDGVFLTHAHMGHYTGLMHFGREVMGTQKVPVHAMPRMKSFLEKNGPWSQLVKLNNIELHLMKSDKSIQLNDRLTVTPITVPHRDEFSETVAFVVKGPNGTALYLPDIDKWSKWERSIEDFIAKVDIAFIDATFFANGEIAGRDMSQIPHPFVEESILRFQSLKGSERAKIHFIHLNHTNPALNPKSQAAAQIRKAGMNLAVEGNAHKL